MSNIEWLEHINIFLKKRGFRLNIAENVVYAIWSARDNYAAGTLLKTVGVKEPLDDPNVRERLYESINKFIGGE